MCGNMKNLFRVLTRISHEWAKRTSEISCSTREINFIFPNIHVLFCLLYKKLLLLSHKIRAVNSNAFHDNRHMWDYHELNHTSTKSVCRRVTCTNIIYSSFVLIHLVGRVTGSPIGSYLIGSVVLGIGSDWLVLLIPIGAYLYPSNISFGTDGVIQSC